MGEVFGSLWETLTPRRREILEMMVLEDITEREVGMRLGIAAQTVKNIKTAALRHLGTWRIGEIRVLIIKEFRRRVKGE